MGHKRVVKIDEHPDQISVTWGRLWGHHDRVVNEISDRVYYIIEGSARFQVGDDTPIETVEAGDFVFIPQHVPYEFEGEMRYIAPEECIQCGACVEACPVDARFAEDQLPNEWASYIEINMAYFSEPKAK